MEDKRKGKVNVVAHDGWPSKASCSSLVPGTDLIMIIRIVVMVLII
jgi:hypothetical protein